MLFNGELCAGPFLSWDQLPGNQLRPRRLLLPTKKLSGKKKKKHYKSKLKKCNLTDLAQNELFENDKLSRNLEILKNGIDPIQLSVRDLQ